MTTCIAKKTVSGGVYVCVLAYLSREEWEGVEEVAPSKSGTDQAVEFVKFLCLCECLCVYVCE